MAELSRHSTRWVALRSHVGSGLQEIRDLAAFLLDDTGRIVSWNRGAEHLLEYSCREILGEAHDRLFTGDDQHAGVPRRELDLAVAHGEARGERWYVRRGGSRFCGASTVVPIRDDDQRLLGFLTLLRDLTADRLAAERLTASEERYRVLVSTIKDYAVFMLDVDGRVNYWTPAAERIKGYTASEIIGQPFATFFLPEDRQRHAPERELQTARERGSIEGFGWRVRKDGSCFWGEEIVTAVYDAAGEFVGYSKITRDCTERHQAELERERLLRDATELNRLKDVFLSTMSHELRTPLHAILGWLQVLRLRHQIPEPVAEGLAVIERNARTQGRLIDDLLDASRIITGKVVVALQPIALATPLAAAVETVKVAADEKGVELIVRHDIAEDAISGDAERMQQIIWNLLSNAIKFTPAGGRVTVTTSTTDRGLELTVTDTGVGIEPEFLPFVFDRFRQADTAPTRQHGGLGLGLSIVKHLVDLHRGHVVVESGGLNQGTTVRLTLPHGPHRIAVQASTGAAAPAGRRIRELAGVRVLVVDDDGDARRMMELALSAQNAAVTLAASARDAVAAVRAERPDIVLADLAMPVEDGFALLTQLRGCLHRHVPIVAITAQARIEDRDRCLEAGFDAYLAKPIDMNEVVDTIVRLAPPSHPTMAAQPASSAPTQSRAQVDARAGTSDADVARRLYDRAFNRIRSEYTAMPSIRLTPDQVERLTGVSRDVCQQVLEDLLGSRYLRLSDDGTYARRSNESTDRAAAVD